jgi:hypothetical protein
MLFTNLPLLIVHLLFVVFYLTSDTFAYCFIY